MTNYHSPTCCNVRQCDPKAVKHIRDHNIVDVRFVARKEEQGLSLLCGFLRGLAHFDKLAHLNVDTLDKNVRVRKATRSLDELRGRYVSPR